MQYTEIAAVHCKIYRTMLSNVQRHKAKSSTVCKYRTIAAHNCIATANRGVMVFVKDFTGIRDPHHFKTVVFTIPPFKKRNLITEVVTQLLGIDLKCPQCFKTKVTRKTKKSNSDFKWLTPSHHIARL